MQILVKIKKQFGCGIIYLGVIDIVIDIIDIRFIVELFKRLHTISVLIHIVSELW